ncbi:MAG TPA: hypothetical protein VFI15_11565 [Candidatus Limnocylindrales bacterium]|nr:hypothetical protein [Candidatus Limnocylindrales bacterium]
MRVDIDGAGQHQQPRRIDDLRGRGAEIRPDVDDRAVPNEDVGLP